MDRMTEVLKSISDAFNTPLRNELVLITFFILVLFFISIIVYYFLFRLYNANKKNKLKKAAKIVLTDIIKPDKSLNVLQKNVIYNIIDDFKKNDLLAQSISHVILEKYSEYLLKHLEKIMFLQKEDMVLNYYNYPIHNGISIELEIVFEKKMYIFESKVISNKGREIIIEYINTYPISLQTGVDIKVHYINNKLFFSGNFIVTNISNKQNIKLLAPRKVKLSDERRYSRISLENVKAYLSAKELKTSLNLFVKDISFEGLKIESNEVLIKNTLYNINFEDNINTKQYKFDNIESIISNEFTIKPGLYEYGMTFMNMNYKTKTILLDYINESIKKNDVNKDLRS